MKKIKDHICGNEYIVGFGTLLSTEGFSPEACDRLEEGQPVILVSDERFRDVHAYGVQGSWGFLGMHYHPNYFISKEEYSNKWRKFMVDMPRFGGD